MSQVNLLPPEILQSQKTRRLAGMILVAGAVLAVLVFAFFLLQVARLSGVQDEIEAQQRQNNAVQDDIDALQRFEDLKIEAQQQQELLSAAYADELSLSQLLMDLSRVTPSDSYVTTLTVTITGGQTTADGITFVGSVNLAGQAVGMDTVAQWITRLEEVEGWVNPWVPSVNTVDAELDFRDFSVTVDLTTNALTVRGRAGAPEAVVPDAE